MAQIDRFIQTIFKTGSQQLVLTAGQRAALSAGGQLRPVSTQPVSLQQIQEMVGEIAPADRKDKLAESGRNEFSYDSPAGTVMVAWARNNGSIKVVLTPAAAAGSIAAATQKGTGSTAGIDAMFRKMVGQNCSDLHLSTGHTPLFRKDGVIVALDEQSILSADQLTGLLRPITPARNWKEFEDTCDTDFAYDLQGVARFRCNLFMDRLGIGGVFRQIPSQIPTAEDLGLSPHILALCNLPKGLVLVTGPTGSGKSTTLAAMISFINQSRPEHLITIEDPIEFVYPKGKCLINQREVAVHTADFKTALRAALREDPDMVLVGEMRDLETVKIALETAETGHLVFGTLHTNTAPSTIDRVIDQFPADEQSQVRTMLAESLKGVIAQTLCRRKEGGRVAAHEILIVNSAVANLIREAKTFQIPSIMQTGRSLGMMTMNDALLELIKKKLITPEEAYSKTYNKADFGMALERHGIHLKDNPAGTPDVGKKQKPSG
jgi:twitching motility protein PilT